MTAIADVAGTALDRRSRWLLAVMHVPLLLAPLMLVTLRPGSNSLLDPALTAAVAGGCILLIFGLQLRHSLAYAQGVRPQWWPATLIGLSAAAYVPLLWLPINWFTAQWGVAASAMMLLPRPAAAAVFVIVVAGTTVAQTAADLRSAPLDPLGIVSDVAYYVLIQSFGSIAVFAAARLMRVIDELTAARAELVDLAVWRERLRVSRDLHDLLGQSLSAVSLKGDLAVRLWRDDRDAAVAQVESLTGVARAALHDVRRIAVDRRTTSLEDELRGAERLLSAAAVPVRVDVTLAGLPPELDDALGWVLREGVTNVLRHSAATEVRITAGRRGGRIRMAIENDGALEPGEPGSGIAGLAERVRPLGGVVTAQRLPGGRFRLTVELPDD